MPILHEKKELVTPGDLLAEGDYIPGDNTYREGNRIYANRLGLADYDRRRVYVVALNAFYTPLISDLVIGKVVDVSMIGWTVDIGAPYLALLRASDVLSRFRPQTDDLSRIFGVGDFILATVVACDRTRDPLLTVREKGLGKINRGQVVKITPTKIPRVIGSKGSMISMLKSETGCDVTVGQNGLILVEGRIPEDERLAIMAIRKIELESHTSGLTNRVTEMIGKEKEGASEN